MADTKVTTALSADDKFAAWISAEFDRYKRFHAATFEKAEKHYNYWVGKPPKREWDWQNQVPIPVMVEGEQTITPRLFTALFPNEAPVDVKVEGDEDPQQGTKIKYLLQHYFRVADVQSTFASVLAQNTLFGTGYIEGGSWYVRRGWQIGDDGVPYETVIESRPDAKLVDFFEIFPHPAKLRMDDGLPLIRRRLCDAGFLRGLMDNPFFETVNIQKALDSEFPDAQNIKDPDQKPHEIFEMLEYWGPKDKDVIDPKDGAKIGTQKARPWWGVVINRKVLIRSIPNPYNHQLPPFCKIRLFPDVKPSWFGVGIGQIGAPTNERLNKMVNQRLDNVDLVLNRQGVYNGNDPLIDRKRLQISRPGKFYKVSDTITSIKFLDIPDVTASSYKEEELAKQYFHQATGAAEALTPAPSDQQHRTAMGIQLMQGAAGARFKPVLTCIEMEGIQQLAFFFFSNLKQFMTNDEWVLVTGENGTTEPIQVTPQDIQAKVFFIPMGVSETVNKEMQLSQFLRYKELTMDDPTVNRQEINRRIAELFGFKDVQKLLTPIQMDPGDAGGLLNPANKLKIQQRLAEGAHPNQIKAEIMGGAPHPGPGGLAAAMAPKGGAGPARPQQRPQAGPPMGGQMIPPGMGGR